MIAGFPLTPPVIARTLLAVCLLASGIAHGQPASSNTTTTEPTPDVSRSAEEVAARLRELTRSLSDTAALEELEAEVKAHRHRTAECWDETGRLLAHSLRTTALDSLSATWLALRNDLDAVAARIAVRVRQRNADLATLTALHESWARALDLGRKADAPTAVLERVQSTVAAIDQTRPPIEQRLAHTLGLQEAVIRSVQTCDDALARIADARQEAMKRAFTPQEFPVWRGEVRTGSGAGDTPGFAADVGTKSDSVRTYARTYGVRLAISLLMILALMIVLRRAASRSENAVRVDRKADSSMAIFRTPYAAAILIGLLITRPLRPTPPFEFQQMMLAIVTTAAVFVLRPMLQIRLLAAVYLGAAVLVVNLVTRLFEPETRLEQILLIVEMSVTAGLLLWAASQLDDTLGSIAPARRRAVKAIVRTVALCCGATALAAALGYLDLADFLGLGLLYAVLLAFGFLAVRLALHDLVTIGLARGPLARLHTVARHRALIDRYTRRSLDGAIIAIWTWFVLGRFQMLEPARELVHGILDTRLRAGQLEIPVAHVFSFFAVVAGVFIATRLVGTLLEEDVYSRMTLPRGVPYALSTLTRYALLLAGFLLALGTLGLDLTRITVLVSALGLGLGFGLQQIMNNFVSGLILLFERPVKVGDSIEMGDLNGDVLRIGIRSSTIRTSQGAEVIVPNSKMIEEKVTNWTLSDRRRRIELDIGVRGDTDAERIIAILSEVARRDPRVNKTPSPEALLVRFGEDGSVFQLRFWTDDPQWTRLRSDLSVALQRTLRAVHIEDRDEAKAKAQTS